MLSHCDNLFVCSGLAVSVSSYTEFWPFCLNIFLNSYFAYCPSYSSQVLWEQCTMRTTAKLCVATLCVFAVSCQVCCKGDAEPPCKDTYRGEAPQLPVLRQELHTGIPVTGSYLSPHWWVMASLQCVSHSILNVGRDKQEVLLPTPHWQVSSHICINR